MYLTLLEDVRRSLGLKRGVKRGGRGRGEGIPLYIQEVPLRKWGVAKNNMIGWGCSLSSQQCPMAGVLGD